MIRSMEQKQAQQSHLWRRYHAYFMEDLPAPMVMLAGHCAYISNVPWRNKAVKLLEITDYIPSRLNPAPLCFHIFLPGACASAPAALLPPLPPPRSVRLRTGCTHRRPPRRAAAISRRATDLRAGSRRALHRLHRGPPRRATAGFFVGPPTPSCACASASRTAGFFPCACASASRTAGFSVAPPTSRCPKGARRRLPGRTADSKSRRRLPAVELRRPRADSCHAPHRLPPDSWSSRVWFLGRGNDRIHCF
ncbi:hypothetical protein GUJ93_ZPchr0001g33130 [Zizania palustris]|uniref:Uncharacterized protein n=1 Tax=Zizania palustris TaxID=103762 RepID=A0A8J5UZK0_ZIZPA|nr:hypothetical protein GUJ93_ZPchr0001g33130 [Zizania palustris]